MKEEFPSPTDSGASYTENEIVDSIKREEEPYSYVSTLPMSVSSHQYSHHRGSNASPTSGEFHSSMKVPYFHQQSYDNQVSYSTSKLCYQTSKLCIDEEAHHYDDKAMLETPIDSNIISSNKLYAPKATQFEATIHDLTSFEKHYTKYCQVTPQYFGTSYSDHISPYVHPQEVHIKLEAENNNTTLLARKVKNLKLESPEIKTQKSSTKKEGKESDSKITNGALGDKKENSSCDSDSNPEKKPPYSYVALIAKALESSRDKKLQLNDIYTYIANNFSYYKNMQDKGNSGWKNSIRHNLSLNDCFIKVARDGGTGGGKGHFWSVDPNQTDMFENNNYKRRRKTRRNSTYPYQQYCTRPRDNQGFPGYNLYDSAFHYGYYPPAYPSVNQLHSSVPMGSSYQLGPHPTAFGSPFTATSTPGLPSEFNAAFPNSIMSPAANSSIPQLASPCYPSNSYNNPRLASSIASPESIYGTPSGYNGPLPGLSAGESHLSSSPLHHQNYDTGITYDNNSEVKKTSDDISYIQISSRPPCSNPFSWSAEREKTFPASH